MNLHVIVQQWKLDVISFNKFDHFTGKIFYNLKTYFWIAQVGGQ